VDLGGTKNEFARSTATQRLHRHRIATPRHDYDGTVRAVAEAVQGIEEKLGRTPRWAWEFPDRSTRLALVKNANSTWLMENL